MPLFLPVLGVETPSAVALWSGILNGITSFIAAFASPLWGRVADRRGRKLMLLRSTLAIGGFTLLMGVAANIWQFFAFRALMGASCRFLQRGDRAGGEPGSRKAARLCPRLAQHRTARRLAGWSSDRRCACRSDGQLPDPLLLHFGDHPDVDWAGLGHCARAVRRAAPDPGRTIDPWRPDRGGPISWPFGFVLCADDGAIRRTHCPTGGDIVRAGAGRRPPRSRDFERHRLLRQPGFPMCSRHPFSATAAM